MREALEILGLLIVLLSVAWAGLVGLVVGGLVGLVVVGNALNAVLS